MRLHCNYQTNIRQAGSDLALSVLFILSLGLTPGTASTAQPTQILIGSPPAPVVSGEVWLIANRWGAYPGILVATIRNGKIETRRNIEFPRYWEQAFDYKLLVAVSDRPVRVHQTTYEDFGYGALGRPEYLKNFPTLYISPPLPAKNLGKDWEEALREIGRFTGNVLTLPSPTRRTIRLEYPDGKPLAGAEAHVSLFGSRENHCGVPVGPALGTFKTDASGEIAFVANDSCLALNVPYLEEAAGGPAGTKFTWMSTVILGSDEHVTVKRLWTLPRYDYVIRLRTKTNRPIVHAYLTACINFNGCGAGCGPLGQGTESNESGTIHFRHEDLRQLGSITVVNSAVQKRDLTKSEMRELLSEHRLLLIW